MPYDTLRSQFSPMSKWVGRHSLPWSKGAGPAESLDCNVALCHDVALFLFVLSLLVALPSDHCLMAASQWPHCSGWRRTLFGPCLQGCWGYVLPEEQRCSVYLLSRTGMKYPLALLLMFAVNSCGSAFLRCGALRMTAPNTIYCSLYQQSPADLKVFPAPRL